MSSLTFKGQFLHQSSSAVISYFEKCPLDTPTSHLSLSTAFPSATVHAGQAAIPYKARQSPYLASNFQIRSSSNRDGLFGIKPGMSRCLSLAGAHTFSDAHFPKLTPTGPVCTSP